MPAKIATTEDLMDLKLELLDEIRTLLTANSVGAPKRFLKSSEVMELLKISQGTLQNLRINGTLPYSKVGGVLLYDWEQIQQVISDNRVDRSF
ncbi:helix-turn-helix domain-containing protein [Maribacter sp. 2307ULW6-5]|uniref:helix-turn-helix domain-containing protein n=1 Tax=Maribacter sp. 2307ULW6-5 TaxID=3386275 RepID=UPI0039BD34C9